MSVAAARARHFGRYPAADIRDLQHLLRRQATSRTYRYWGTGWKGDQEDTPRCVGYAWCHWLNSDPIRQHVHPGGLYAIAQYFDEWEGTDYDGTSVRAGAKVLAELGFIAEYRWTFDVRVLVNTLLTRGPVVVGTDWYEGMNEPDHSGLIEPTGRVVGGHAYLVSGVNTKRGLLRLDNSWGNQWGDNGRASITIDDMAKLIRQDGECCIGVEARPAGRG